MVDHVGCCMLWAGESTRPYVFSGNPFSRNPAMHFSPCRFPPMMEFRRSRAEWRATEILPTRGGPYLRKSKTPHFPLFIGVPAGGVSNRAEKGLAIVRPVPPEPPRPPFPP